MSTASAFGGSDPRRQLARARELARGVRRTQRAIWFPLFVFAALTFVAIPVTRIGHRTVTVCRTVHQPGGDGRVCLVHNSAAYVYWPIALVLAYGVIAAFYVLRSRARGVGTRIRAYVVAGIAFSVVVTLASVWAAHHPPIGAQDILGWHAQGADIYRFLGPATAIGLGLLVLAFAERSLALFVVAVGYLWIALVPVDFGWVIAQPSRWAFLPHLVVDGTVLLVAALGFAVAQRIARRSPA